MIGEEQNGQTSGRQPRWLMPSVIGGLVLVAALAAVLLTRTPAPVAQEPTAPAAQPAVLATGAPAVPTAQADVQHGGLNPDGPAVEQISLAEARALFDAGTAIFIDLRSSEVYAESHIPGALTITSRELEPSLAQAGPEVVIIAYGDATRPESGMRGAQIFMELGYPKVIALEGGFQSWRDAGYPVEALLRG